MFSLSDFLENEILSEAKDKDEKEKKKKGEENEDPDIEDTQKTDTEDTDNNDNEKNDTEEPDFTDVDNEIEDKEKDTNNDDTGEDDLGTDTETDNTEDIPDETPPDDTGDDLGDTPKEGNTDTNDDTTTDDSEMNNDDNNDNEISDDEQSNDNVEEKIKNKSLLQDYFSLYTSISNLIQTLSNVSGIDKLEYSTLLKINENLLQLKYCINEYINIRFINRSYEENLSMYYKIVNSLKITEKIISNIVNTHSQLQTNN